MEEGELLREAVGGGARLQTGPPCLIAAHSLLLCGPQKQNPALDIETDCLLVSWFQIPSFSDTTVAVALTKYGNYLGNEI